MGGCAVTYNQGSRGIEEESKFLKKDTVLGLQVPKTIVMFISTNFRLFASFFLGGRAGTYKPTIHYLRIRWIGDETIFSPNKILFTKTVRTCFYTLFVVRHQFSAVGIFFDKELLCVCRRDCYLDENPANNVGEKPVCEIWRTLTTYHSLYISFS